MKVIEVKFDSYGKSYFYKCRAELCVGKKYFIEGNTGRKYENPVKIIANNDYEKWIKQHPEINLHTTIIKAEPANQPHVKYGIKRVIFDEASGVTVVIWADKTKTVVRCGAFDEFDKEKAIALCFMKRWCFDNKGNFNNALKAALEEN